MLNLRKDSFTKAVFIFVMISLVVFVGCSQSPTGVTEEPSSQPQLLTRSSISSSGLALSPVPLHTEAVISSESGGTLTLHDVILEIPAGALDNDTLFTIDIPDINVFFNEFGTDGLVFNKPVKVTMSYRDADLSGVVESTIRIGWYNERTGSFDDIECAVDFDSKTVTGLVYHFSAYALISD